MSNWTRRGFIAATGLTAACTATGISKSMDQIDLDIDAARANLFRTVPGTEQLSNQAAGVLIIPEITEAGLFFGGSYGEGGLLIGDAKVDRLLGGLDRATNRRTAVQSRVIFHDARNFGRFQKCRWLATGR